MEINCRRDDILTFISKPAIFSLTLANNIDFHCEIAAINSKKITKNIVELWF